MGGRRPALHLQALAVLLATAMVAALLVSLAGFWRQQFPTGDILLLAAAAGLAGWAGWHRPWTLTATLTTAIAAALVLPLLHGYLAWRWQITLLEPLSEPIVSLLRRLFDLYGQVRQGRFETMHPQVAWFFLALTGLGAGLAITAEALARGDTFWSLAFGAGLFGFQWALFWEEAQPLLLLYTAGGVILWALAWSAHRALRWHGEGRQIRHLPHWGSGVGVALLVTFTAGLLPAGLEPVDLGAAAARVREAFPALQQLRGAGPGGGGRSTRFGLQFVGFGGDPENLGGPAFLDDGIALRLQLDAPGGATPLYLRGSVHTRYTGRGWVAPDDAAARPVGLAEVLPTAYAARVPKLYVKARIIPDGLRTDSLFHLLEPVGVEGVRNYRADADQNLTAPAPRQRGQAYNVQARVARTSAAQIRELGAREVFLRPDAAPAELRPYLELPPPNRDLARVEQAARLITRGAEHPLDKALALEAWLRSSEFRYNLRVAPVPRGRDFVAYFLSTREGYCTYFATAMAVMLRQLGIPSRWVQGFVAVPGGAREAPVPNSQAHAWVEAYFPGYGWVTFDPTPRADFPAPDRSFVVPPDAPGAAPDPRDELTLLDPNVADATAELADVPPPAATGSAQARGAAGGAAAGALLLALLAGLGYSAWRLRLPVARDDDALAVQQLWCHTGHVLGQFGYGPRPDQTPGEYAGALARAWPELGDLPRRAAAAYAAARYAPAGAPLPAGGRADAGALLTAVQGLLRRRHGRLGYLWGRLTGFRRRWHRLEQALRFRSLQSPAAAAD